MHKDTATTLKLASVLLILFCAYLFKSALIAPPNVDPAHEFNTQRAFDRLARILGDETPHPVDSHANDAVITRLLTEIETLGFTPHLTDRFHCVESWRSGRCARLQNIAFWVGQPGPNAVLLLSHHDSVPAGPGASDDGAGVASSLEIASILKGKTLNRPLLVLITDGEELGLMGANMFVEHDPLAQMVGAVVNMEARGISGLAAFFQTSRPNGRDLKALSGTTRLPVANSMSADIYELMPNDTDMSEFLHLPIDAANLAYTDGVAFYHTPGDNLANMDKRALFHLGASGLAATKIFLGQTGQEAESQLLYIDILGLFLVILPPALTALILIFSALLALSLLWKTRTNTVLWRVAIVPLCALVLGGGFAFGATALVDLLRPERFFGAAYPMALRALHASAALTGALIIYTFMTRPGEAKPLLASAWLWTAILGLVTFFTVQGAAILFAPPLAFFALASIALWLGRDKTGFVLASLGTLLFAVTTLPSAAVGESNLFIENAGPFAIILVLLFGYIAPLIWPHDNALLRSFWLTLVGTGAVMVVSLIASIFVPAYSPETPRHLSINHIQSAQSEAPIWSISGNDAVPDALMDIVPFTSGKMPIYGAPGQIAPAPSLPSNFNAAITSDRVANGIRTLTLSASDPQSDRMIISFDTDTPMNAITLNGIPFKAPETITNLVCSGRSCRDFRATFSFPADAPPRVFDALSLRFGLGPEGAKLLAARPDWTIPRQRGDARYTHIRITPEKQLQSN